MKVHKLQDDIQDIMVDKGWLDGEDTLPELVAHCHSELSEVVEALRKGGNRDPRQLRSYWRDEVGYELADVLLSTLVMFNFTGLDAEAFIKKKLKVLGEREPHSFFDKGDRK